MTLWQRLMWPGSLPMLTDEEFFWEPFTTTWKKSSG